jgi:cytochrome b pre-mRNA-processing protein 3
MLHHLIRFFRPSDATHHAYTLYAHINEESRKPYFFTNWGMPDSLDGRFELILLHMFLYLHSLKQKPQDTEGLQRRLIEAFFEDMDRSIREIGVTDTGVGKRIKRMANAFYGRIHAYEKGLEDDAKLADAIRKNMFGTVKQPPEDVSSIVEYIRRRLEELHRQDIELPEFVNIVAEERAS